MISPRKRFLLVEPEEPVRSIEIPWRYFDTMVTGRVKAVGPAVKDIAAGDRVLMGRWAGLDFEHERRNVYLCHEREIDAVVPDDILILARPPGSDDVSKPPVRSMLAHMDGVEVKARSA